MICVRSLALLENHITYLCASTRIHAKRFLSNPAPLQLLALIFFSTTFFSFTSCLPWLPAHSSQRFQFLLLETIALGGSSVLAVSIQSVPLLFPPPLSFSCLAASSTVAPGFWLRRECTALSAWCFVFFSEHLFLLLLNTFFSMHLAHPILIVHQQFSVHLAQAESASQSKCNNNNV